MHRALIGIGEPRFAIPGAGRLERVGDWWYLLLQHGAPLATLRRRATYGGRKGRRAQRRLRAIARECARVQRWLFQRALERAQAEGEASAELS